MEQRTDAQMMGDQLDRDHPSGDPFATAIRKTRMPMLITDPRQPDNPIVFANDAFCEMTGYGRDEVIGHNCRFLQGPDTDPEAINTLRRAIAEAWPICRCDILNYRKDGTQFWNALFMSPVLDENGQVVFFFASQHDVSDRKRIELTARERRDELEAEVARRTAQLRSVIDELQATADARTILLHEVDHRVKNNLQMISALVQLQARRTEAPPARAALTAVLGRIEALATVHRRLYQGEKVHLFDIAAFARDLVGEFVVSSAPEVRLDLDLGPVEIPAEKAGAIALMINEVMTGALARMGTEGGTLTVMTRRTGGSCEIMVTAAFDAARPPREDEAFSRLILETLGRQLRATTTREDMELWTRVHISFPVADTQDERPT